MADDRPVLLVPPFAADYPPAPVVEIPPPDDPVSRYADLGLRLPPVTLRGEVRPGVPVWTMQTSSPYWLWNELQARHPHTGLWPLVTGDDTWESSHFEFDDGADADPVVAQDGQAWLEAAFAARGEGQPFPEFVHLGPGVEHFDAVTPWWELLDSPADESGEVALIPAGAGWLAPGLIGWTGAVNHDLDGSDHATLLRRWHGHWGLEPVALTRDLLSFRMSRPPATPEAALALAAEMYLYCPDAVDQGTQDLSGFGNALTGQGCTLWWD